MLDFETLRVLWWLLLGVLLIGFAIMDGFDLGALMCLPLVGKKDEDKRIILNTVGPFWEGNQVWFILGGGAIFAAWPPLYDVSFSGFYLAMLVVLLSFIIRPVGFKYRSKMPGARWRRTWDLLLCLSGLVPALIFGVAIGNVLQGVPFHFDSDLRSFYTGSFFALLNPFALGCGVLSVLMLLMHGACYLSMKTLNPLSQRAKNIVFVTGPLVLLVYLAMGFYLYFAIDGYTLISNLAHDGASNPLHKEVVLVGKGWFKNYFNYPILLIAPLLGLLMPILVLVSRYFEKTCFVLSALGIAGIISSVGLAMFPFILPSSSNPAESLMVWDSSSSETTLFIMTIATVIFLPIVLVYTAWVYRVMRGKVSDEFLEINNDSAY